MRKIAGKKNINEILGYINFDSYTKQTINSLFRTLLETILESANPAIVLFKVKDIDSYKSILTRLSFSDISVYADNTDFSQKFSSINTSSLFKEEEQYLLINADRFSALLYWKENQNGLSESICTLNPSEVKNFLEYIQENLKDIRIEKDLSELKLDRRGNEKFTTILRKLMASIENNERELIVANSELENLQSAEDEISDINKLISTLAHEIRNPLGLINTYSQIISKQIENIDTNKEEVTSSIVRASENIKKASHSLENLLNELIEFNKVIKLNLSYTSLNSTLNEIVELTKPICEEKNIKLNFVNTDTIETMIDTQKIHQVLLNLIKNAIEASCADSQIKLELKDFKNYAEILISDNGCGIDSKNMEKVFEPYFTTKTKGTGIGLSYSKKIIDTHKGSLSLVSTSEKGTTFSLKLPIAREV